jgi:hypothetical protein
MYGAPHYRISATLRFQVLREPILGSIPRRGAPEIEGRLDFLACLSGYADETCDQGRCTACVS